MIRLQRTGRKNDPYFRVVLTDRRNSPKSRNFTEILGDYDVKKGKITLKGERILHWIKMGAKTSPTMHNFLVSEKIISGKKINVLPRKSPIKKEGSESAPQVAAEAVSEPVAGKTSSSEVAPTAEEAKAA
ncbi:MAG: 30S ribosomal protein S16 [Patescibacteria group bacterium]